VAEPHGLCATWRGRRKRANANADHLESELLAVQPAERFAEDLRRRVHRVRTHGRVWPDSLRARIEARHVIRAREDDPPNVTLARGFEHVVRHCDVRLEQARERGLGADRGKVDDDVDAGEDVANVFELAEVDLRDLLTLRGTP
jgi:hypothetical protein